VENYLIVRNSVNAGLSLVILVAVVVSLTMLSPDWTIALVPVCIVAIVYLNLDPLIALVNAPHDGTDH
jgi:hypothetical protein